MTLPTRLTCGFGWRRSVFVAALVLFSALPAAGQVGDRRRDSLAWVPYAEISPATTLLGRPDYVGDDYESAKTWAMHKIAVIQAARGDVAGAKNTLAQIGYRGNVGEVTGVWFLNGEPIYDRPPAGSSCPPAQGFSPCLLRPAYAYDGSIVPGVCLLNRQLFVPCAGACGPRPPSPAIEPPMAVNPAASSQDPPVRVTPPPAAVRLASSDSGGRDAHVSRNPVPAFAGWVERSEPRHVSGPFKTAADLPADYLAADPTHGAVVDFCDDRDSHGTRVTLRKYADGFAVIETP